MLCCFMVFVLTVTDESPLSIVIDEDTDEEGSECGEFSSDSESPSSPAPTAATLAPELAPKPAAIVPSPAATSTQLPSVIASNHVTTPVSNHVISNHNHISRSGDETDQELRSHVMSNNISSDGDLKGTCIAGSTNKYASGAGSANSLTNNKNNSISYNNRMLEIWNFNCKLKTKICKEVKKPGRGECLWCQGSLWPYFLFFTLSMITSYAVLIHDMMLTFMCVHVSHNYDKIIVVPLEYIS